MPLMEQNHKRHICFIILHRLSISSPSILHRNDGPSMEYRWSIYGGIREKQRSFLRGRAFVHRVKNQERRKIKIPYRQGIHEEFDERCGNERVTEIIKTLSYFSFPKYIGRFLSGRNFRKTTSIVSPILSLFFTSISELPS